MISTSWVVTAAHCIVKILDKSKIKVRVGTEAFNTSDATQNVQMFDVGNIYIHPKYKSIVLFNYDIALIKLKKPARLEEFVNTICVDEKGVDSDNCWIAGWGKIGSDAHSIRPDVLREIDVRLVNQQSCLKAYRGQVTDKMLCAGSSKKDACLFDSGGPLICGNRFQRNKWTLSGVISWGPKEGCGHGMGVYTNVLAVRDWIVSVLYCTSSHRLREFYPDKHTPNKVLQNSKLQQKCT